jgi:hypothetical protein
MFQEDVIHGKPSCNTQSGVSLIRDLRIAHSDGPAVLAFDRDQLARRFWLQQIDVIRIKDYTGFLDEYQEQLIGDLTPLVSFVKEVMVNDEFACFEQMMLANDPTIQPVFDLIRSKMKT